MTMNPLLLQIRMPDIDPVIFHLGPVAIRWYGFSYLLGFLVGWAILRKLAKRGLLPLAGEQISDLLTALMLGVILGGRLGYVLFYKPLFYLGHPLEIIAFWDGGMSFHGGLIGVALACFLFARKAGISFLSIIDATCIATCPGIFFTRMANFINQELWGRPTDVPWAVVFSNPAAGGIPRHPSQIYEGLLEGVLLFCVLWFLSTRRAMRRPGALACSFLIGYGTLRFVVEFFREPDRHLGTVLGPFSMGQVLSSGMILVGATGLIRILIRSRDRGTDMLQMDNPPEEP